MPGDDLQGAKRLSRTELHFFCMLEISYLFYSVIIRTFHQRVNVSINKTGNAGRVLISANQICLLTTSSCLKWTGKSTTIRWNKNNHSFHFLQCSVEASHYQLSTCCHKVKIKCWIPNSFRIPASLILTLTSCLHWGWFPKAGVSLHNQDHLWTLGEMESPPWKAHNMSSLF